MLKTPLLLAETFLRAFEPTGWLVAASRILSRKGASPEDFGLDGRDPQYIWDTMPVFEWLADNWFDLKAYGLENVPKEGAALMPGNHNSGMLAVEFLLLFPTFWRHFGPDRAMYGLGHDIVMDHPWLRRPTRGLGALRASHQSAHNAFDEGALVVVFPGSEYDTFRPSSMKNTVVLNGRKGFVRLALGAGVPVVPWVARGAHDTWHVFTDGRGLARAMGLKKLLRTDVLPIVASMPWGISSGYLPHLPMPCQIDLAFGRPISWSESGPEAAADDELVDRCFRQVEGTMQGMLDWLVARKQGLVEGDEVPTFEIPGGQ